MTILDRQPKNGSRSAFGNMTEALFNVAGKLSGFAQKSMDSEIKPSDLAQPAAPPADDTEETIVSLVSSRYKRAADSKFVHVREWLENDAFYEGNQWVEWREGTNQLEATVDPDDPYRKFPYVNLIEANCTRIHEAACSGDPDVAFSPARMDAVSQGAAAEAEDIWEYLCLKEDWRTKKSEAVAGCLPQGVHFIKWAWNPNAEALTWTVGPGGQIVTHKAKVGDIECCVIPAYEIYPDPDGNTMRDWDWLIHAKKRPLEWIQERYGERGFLVEPQTADAYQGYIDLRLDAIKGDALRGGAGTNSNSAYVYEMWERPTARYKKGRYIVVANDRWMNPDKWDWPYDYREWFPFAPLPFKSRPRGPWPMNIVSNQKPGQRLYNTILARTYDRLQTQRVTILVGDDTEISTDSYHLKANMQKVVFNSECKRPPAYQVPPPVDPAEFQMLEFIKRELEDYCGTHNLNPEQAQIESGVAIELKQQQDRSMFRGLTDGIESCCETSAKIALALARQFYKEPRLMALSQDPGQNARINAHDFRNLAAGGQVNVKVEPGSGIARNPAARDQKILTLMQGGAFQPQNLPATVLALELFLSSREDPILRKFKLLAEQMLEQQRMQAAQPAAIAAHVEEQKAAAQQQDHANAMELQTLKGQQEIAKQQQADIGKSQLITQENQEEALLASTAAPKEPNVSFAFKGTVGPTATQSLERKYGIEPDSVDEIREAAAPAPQLDPNKVLDVQAKREATATQAETQRHATETQAATSAHATETAAQTAERTAKLNAVKKKESK